MVSFFHLLLVFCFLFSSSSASGLVERVSILGTDPKVVLYPPGTNQGWGFSWLCGQTILGDPEYNAGAKASFSFTGSSVSATFMKDSINGMAEIWLDGSFVTRVDTHEESTSLANCRPVSWSSGSLDYGNHNVTIWPILDPLNRKYATGIYLHNFEYVGERGTPSPVYTPIPQPNSIPPPRFGLNIRLSMPAITAVTAIMMGLFLCIGIGFFASSFSSHTSQRPLTSKRQSQSALLGSSAKFNNWKRALLKLLSSAVLVVAAVLCAYALSEDQPLGTLKGVRLSTLLLQLAGLLPQMAISMLAYETLHMGITAQLNGDGVALSQIDAAANGVSLASFLSGGLGSWQKGWVVRLLSVLLGVIAALLRFTLSAYPLLPGALYGSVAPISLYTVGEQGWQCPSCAEMTDYLSIANTVTIVGNATLSGTFSGPNDAIVIPPFYSTRYTNAARAYPQMETVQDTLKLTQCSHYQEKKPTVRPTDMEYLTSDYGTVVFGFHGSWLKISIGYGDFGSGKVYNDSYSTMECFTEIRRYSYIQNAHEPGPIKIIRELNASYVPQYNLSSPGFTQYVYASRLQLDLINDEREGIRNFLGMIASMIRGGRMEPETFQASVGVETGSFRLDLLAVKLLLISTTVTWSAAALLLIFYTHRAGCVATGADSVLLMAARCGPEVDGILVGQCNGNHQKEALRTRVRARIVKNRFQFSKDGEGEKLLPSHLVGC